MISAVVLAAGLSTRMGGEPKGLLPFDERDTFVTRIVRTFVEAGIADIVVVIGHDAPRVRAALEQSGLPVRVVVNAAYQQGQFSSLLAGLDAGLRGGAAGADGERGTRRGAACRFEISRRDRMGRRLKSRSAATWRMPS